MPKFIVANWKAYLTLSESVALAQRLAKLDIRNSKLEIVVCPSFVALPEVARALRGTRIKLGAQDVWPESRGAYTGEVGLDDLRELGVEYVLVGHSERRQYQGEDNELVNRKLRAVLEAGMRPILCVGEPNHPQPLLGKEGKSSGRRGKSNAQKYVANQLRAGLRGVAKKDWQRVIVAYEPIWAIGTGRPAKPEDAEAMHEFIYETLSKLSFEQSGRKKLSFSVLYGGSVNSENAGAFLNAPSVDGLLVGGASTKAEELIKILKL